MNCDSFNLFREQRGMIAVVVALLFLGFIGVAAIVIDVAHLFLVRNELQNSADAGSLAGARFLYLEDGVSVNESANQIAYLAAVANQSEGTPVDVNWSGGNSGDVERGHWSFSTRTFTPNASLQPVSLWDVSPEGLDANVNFINAIRVTTRRQATPATSIFARIFGYEYFTPSAEAIAYIGFAGTLTPGEADQPLAICKETLLESGQYTCSTGRKMSMGEQVPGQETGGWSDFTQENPCFNGVNFPTIRPLVCGGGNPNPILRNRQIATSGGDIFGLYDLMRSCWESATGRMSPWTLMLPVIDCPGNTVDTCASVAGAVTLHIVWMTGGVDDPTYSDAPWVMDNPLTGSRWFSNHPDGQVRWDSFVQSFNLQNLDGSPAAYAGKSIYFLPDCTNHQPAGRTGGENFGVLAKIPVLTR
jgi:hypothetical protein